MGDCIVQEKVVLLFETYGYDSAILHKSFERADCNFPVVVIEDNGFLPENVHSVYGHFIGSYKTNKKTKPRYFNEILVPDLWEIRSNNVSGEVFDLYHKRANIFYKTPTHERNVQVVDWIDENGVVRYSDHYNKYGAIYARTTFDKNGKKILKSYFSYDGKEVIVENFVTHNIILNDGDFVNIFNNKTEFVIYYLKLMGYDDYRIFFNTLSVPFFVSCSLKSAEKKDILFWQEPINNSIPANMQMILDGKASRTNKIFVQKGNTYDNLIKLNADTNIIKRKGFIYSFSRQNGYRPSALICTNSDQIEQCEYIISALPQVEFHIAAITEMSSKLLSMGKYKNVHLYPTVKKDMISKLFKNSDIYLDINHGNQILSAVQRAFLNNQLIFAFENTLHNQTFISKEHIYQNAHDLVNGINQIIISKENIDKHIDLQRKSAMAENVQSFISDM